MAAVDYFLKVDGIEGESSDAKHKGEIDVESWSWGVTQTGTQAVGGGGGAGKAQFSDFGFNKVIDKSSPKLFLACASGQHIKIAVLTCRKAGERQEEFYKVTFEDLLVSSFQQSAGGELPTESISFNYAKIEIEYKVQKPDGSLGETVRAGWDLKAGKKA